MCYPSQFATLPQHEGRNRAPLNKSSPQPPINTFEGRLQPGSIGVCNGCQRALGCRKDTC